MNLNELIKATFDKAELNNESKAEHFTFYVWEMAFNLGFQYGKSKKQLPIEFFKERLFKNNELKALIINEYKISDTEFFDILNKFYREKSALQTPYPDEHSLLKHCHNYLKYQLNNRKASIPPPSGLL